MGPVNVYRSSSLNDNANASQIPVGVNVGDTSTDGDFYAYSYHLYGRFPTIVVKNYSDNIVYATIESDGILAGSKLSLRQLNPNNWSSKPLLLAVASRGGCQNLSNRWS